ncbi:MAG: MoxR-like ATPase [Verrucomicrobia bacterium]|nr:MAG: MoxR-like ATPase [Verrucomicrobiota bacterium]
MPEIKFISGPMEGRVLILNAPKYTIGRKSNRDLFFNDESCSGEHAELRLENNEWSIVDLKSSNGTWLNQKKISSAVLASGDSVKIGESVFVFSDSEKSAHRTSSDPHAPPTASTDELALVEKMRDHADRIRKEVGKVIVGQSDVLEQILMCILAGGHALLIGLPGMAKTLTVRTIAQVLNLKFKRVQFTPDLMPGDIIGTDVLETNAATGEKEFRFIRGPIFCNLLLADEINRTPPKTQAALLEAMQEKMVTAGNTSYTLEEPFFVLATQNPIEQEGTYPLPEAQLDRFMFNIWVDYPLPHEEEEILRATTGGARIEPKPVLTQEELLQLQAVVRKVPVSDHVIKYVTRLVGATRRQNADAPQVTKTFVSTGAGPRAGQYLILAAKAMAILDGRIHVSCADIRRAAPPVLRHRILTNFAADSEGLTSLDIVKKLLEVVPEPGAEAYTNKPKQ